MAIEGPIRELGLVDLLQLIHLSRKTGVLTVEHRPRGAQTRLDFDRGAVVAARSASGPRIGELLVAAGRATEAQVRRALAARDGASLRLGEVLARDCGVEPAEVERQLQLQAQETVVDLLRWTDGDFRFEDAPAAEPRAIPLRVSTEGLLMEAMRREDEWRASERDALDDELIPQLVESDASTGALSLDPAEWEVLAAVDGERSLRALGVLLDRPQLEVARAIFTLVGAGVVELGHRHLALQASNPGDGADVDAIRAAIDAGDLDLARGRLEALPDTGGERHNALPMPRAEVAERRGEWRAAVAAYAALGERDPLDEAGYYSLGLAALRAGDLAGADAAFASWLRLAPAEGKRRDRVLRARNAIAELLSIQKEREP